MNTFEAIIFDLDDIFYPQWEYVLGGYRAVANYMFTVYGTQIYNELAKQYSPGRTEKLLTDVLAGHFKHVEIHFLNRLVNVYWSHRPKINLYPDMRTCLAFMRAMKIKLGLVTDGRSDVQRAKVKALELSPLLDTALYTSDLLGENKMTDAFQIAELLLDIPLSHTIYVGNTTTSDFQIAHRLGMGTVLVRRSVQRAENEPNSYNADQDRHVSKEAIPDVIIHSLDEINDAVNSQK